MSTTLTSTPARSRQTWEQWQHSTVSERRLSEKDRRQGYTVLWVPPPLREPFLDIANVLRLYDVLFHKRKRALSTAQLASLVAWSEATWALIAALQEDSA